MPNLNEAGGWLMIAGGVCYGSGSLIKLASARRSGARLHAIPVWAGSGLFVGLMCLACGVSWLNRFRWNWLISIAAALSIAYLMTALVTGIVSRRKAGLRWWRFVTHRTLSPGLTSAPSPRPPAELSTETVAFLIQRIKNARFSTTRFAPGYDEQEVDTLLDKLIAVLGEVGRLDPALVRGAQFSVTRIRPGYVIQDVDSFLDDIERAV